MERPSSKLYHLLKILIGLFLIAVLLGKWSMLLESAAQGGSNSADMFAMMYVLIGLILIFQRPRLVHYGYGIGLFLIGFGWFLSFAFSQWFVRWGNYYRLPVLLLFCWGLWNDIKEFREFRKNGSFGTKKENQ